MDIKKTKNPNRVVVKAPATTANLGPGFDVFGMALEQPCDKVTINAIPSDIKIEISGISSETIPIDPEKNTAGVVAKEILENFSLQSGVMIKLEKGIPLGGLGSSAASAAAAAFGINYLFDLKLDKKEIIEFAAKGEVASAGFEHADNVSAAVYGDFTIVRSYKPLDVIHVGSPPNLGVCIAIPDIPLQAKKTEKARSVLPKTVSMDKFVYNIGHAASMSVGFVTGDVELIGRSMSDAVVESARAFLIPGYKKLKEKALKSGACGVAISGAGPAIIAILDRKKIEASTVLEAMKEEFRSMGISSNTFCTKPGKGVSLLEVK